MRLRFAAPQNMLAAGWTNYKFMDYIKIGTPDGSACIYRGCYPDSCIYAVLKWISSQSVSVERIVIYEPYFVRSIRICIYM